MDNVSEQINNVENVGSVTKNIFELNAKFNNQMEVDLLSRSPKCRSKLNLEENGEELDVSKVKIVSEKSAEYKDAQGIKPTSDDNKTEDAAEEDLEWAKAAMARMELIHKEMGAAAKKLRTQLTNSFSGDELNDSSYMERLHHEALAKQEAANLMESSLGGPSRHILDDSNCYEQLYQDFLDDLVDDCDSMEMFSQGLEYSSTPRKKNISIQSISIKEKPNEKKEVSITSVRPKDKSTQYVSVLPSIIRCVKPMAKKIVFSLFKSLFNISPNY